MAFLETLEKEFFANIKVHLTQYLQDFKESELDDLGHLCTNTWKKQLRSYIHDSWKNCLDVPDKFKEVPPPKYISDGDIFSLTVIKGCLSMFLSTSNDKLLDVWTMKEYGEMDFWKKLFTIPCEFGSRVCYNEG